MVAPTTSYPCSTRRAAATELSTPPDMATSTFSRTAEDSRELAHLLDDRGEDLGGPLDVGPGGAVPEAEADGAERELPRHPHGGEHVRRLDRPRGAGRASRDGDPGQVEVHEQRLAVRSR